MRDIRFRGYNEALRKWVYGYLSEAGGHFFIECKDGVYPIIENSVGQYTGLKDKNGKEIYEGDIVKIGDYPTYEVTINEFTQVHVIDNEMGMEELWRNHKVCKVTGNVYENPELLEEN